MRLILFAVFTLAALAVVAAVPVSAMVFLMSPDACVDRPVAVSQEDSDYVQDLVAQIQAGAVPENGQVTLTESEVSSRLVEILERKDAPVEDVRVHLCPEGYAEVTGKVKRLGMEVDVLVRGDVEVSGSVLTVNVMDTEIGGLPGGLSGGWADRVVEEVIRNNGLYVIDIGVNLESVEIGDGYVTITGALP